MKKVFKDELPRIGYIFGDMTSGGHNLQAFKTIIASGAADNCVVFCIGNGEDNSLEKKINKLGINVNYICFSKKNYFKSIKNLQRALIENKCKIAHSNGLQSDLACYYATKKTDIVHVITLHNYLREDAYLRMNKMKAFVAVFLQKQLLKKAKYVIACSKTLKKQMEQDIPGISITAIQNGVDIENFPALDKNSIREKYGYDQDELIFISTGSMTLRKRIPETINAFIKANVVKSRLLLVGNGPLLDKYKNMYDKYPNINFLGRRNDINELLNISDIFVSSSESEGLPLAVLEALAVGNQVILSDIPQHLEILCDLKSAGYCYELGNEEQLAKFMNNYQAENIEKNYRKISALANTKFDITVMGKTYAEYYMKLGACK